MKSYNINVLIWHQGVVYSELFTKNKQDAGVWFNVNDSCCQHVERSGEGRSYRTTEIIQKLAAHLQIQRVKAEKMKIIFCCKHVMQQTNKHQKEKVSKQCNSDSSSFKYQVTQNERMRTLISSAGGGTTEVKWRLLHRVWSTCCLTVGEGTWTHRSEEKRSGTHDRTSTSRHTSENSVFFM